MRKKHKIYIFIYAYIRNGKKSAEKGVNWAGIHMKTFFSKSIYKNMLTIITSRKQVGERRFFHFILSTLLEFSNHLLALVLFFKESQWRLSCGIMSYY